MSPPQQHCLHSQRQVHHGPRYQFFYYGTPMERFEYEYTRSKLPIKLIPDEIIAQYNQPSRPCL